jgi:hypothetical protein
VSYLESRPRGEILSFLTPRAVSVIQCIQSHLRSPACRPICCLTALRPGSNENLDPPLSVHVLAMQAKLLTKNLKEPAHLKICLKRPCMAKHGGSRTCMADPWRRQHVMPAAPGVGHAISNRRPSIISIHLRLLCLQF